LIVSPTLATGCLTRNTEKSWSAQQCK